MYIYIYMRLTMSSFLVGKNYARNNSITHIKIPNSGLFEFNKNIENGFKSTSAAEVVNRVLVPVPSNTHTDIPLDVEVDLKPSPIESLSPTGLSLLDTRDQEKIYTLQEGTNGNTKYIALLDKNSNKATIRTTTGALVLFPGDSPVKLKYFNKWRIITSGRSLVPYEEFSSIEHTGYKNINNIISRDGNKLIIGIGEYVVGTDSGAILVYNKNITNTGWDTSPTILNQPIGGAGIGNTMAASANGNTIATTLDDGGNISILVFKYVNNVWNNTSISIGSITNYMAISADGNTIVFNQSVQIPFQQATHSINIYKYSNEEWSESSIIPIDNAPTSIAVDSAINTIVIGSGGGFIFNYKIIIYTEINTIWTAIERAQNISGEGGKLAISANGDRIITTIPAGGTYLTGAIVIYDKINNIWNSDTILLTSANSPTIGDVAISADGNTIVTNIDDDQIRGIFIYNYSNTGWKLYKRIEPTTYIINGSISINGDGSMVSSNYYSGKDLSGVITYE